MWQELILVLSKILDVYKELLLLSKEKQPVLVAVDMKGLERIVRREQMLIATVGKLEQKREAVLTELLVSENITAPNKELLDLLVFCDAVTGEKLKLLHQGFKTTLEELEANTEKNDFLIKQALTAVNYNLNVLSNASVGATYAAEGKEQITHAKRFECDV